MQALSDKGIAVVQPEILGHGYSDGVPRAYVKDYKHWLDDHRLMMNLVAGGPNTLTTSTKEQHASDGDAVRDPERIAASNPAANGHIAHDAGQSEFNLGLTPEQAEQLARVPLFLGGESLGGGQALSLGVLLQDEVAAGQQSEEGAERAFAVAQRFAGVCLIAPAIR